MWLLLTEKTSKDNADGPYIRCSQDLGYPWIIGKRNSHENTKSHTDSFGDLFSSKVNGHFEHMLESRVRSVYPTFASAYR